MVPHEICDKLYTIVYVHNNATALGVKEARKRGRKMRLIDKDELMDWIINEPSDIDNPDNALVNQYDGATFRQIEILGHIETMPEVTVEDK